MRDPSGEEERANGNSDVDSANSHSTPSLVSSVVRIAISLQFASSREKNSIFDNGLSINFPPSFPPSHVAENDEEKEKMHYMPLSDPFIEPSISCCCSPCSKASDGTRYNRMTG